MDKGKKGVFGDGKYLDRIQRRKWGEIFGGKTSPYSSQWHFNIYIYI